MFERLNLKFLSLPIVTGVIILSSCGGSSTSTSLDGISSDGISSTITPAGTAPVPTIASITPTTVPPHGTVPITISGTLFSASSSVTVNGMNCPVTSASTTSITCTSPTQAIVTSPGTPVVANVIVTTPDVGASVPYTSFTYSLAPILGQASATSSSFGSGYTAMNNPKAIAIDGIHVVVADNANCRVLIWNSIPTTLNQAPDLVLGQADFNLGSTHANRGGAIAANTLYSPNAVAIYKNKLFVSDSLNHRVLIWNTFPTTNGQAADLVIGQSNLNGGSVNAGIGTNIGTLNSPSGLAIDSAENLYISDTGNHRVLYFSTIPINSGAAATYVLGQATFTANGSNTTEDTLKSPIQLSVSENYLAVSDSGNNRVLIFSTLVNGNSKDAVGVLGQSSFISNDSVNCFSTSISSPQGIALLGNTVFVSDTGHNHILFWPSISSIIIPTFRPPSTKNFGGTTSPNCTPNQGGISQTSLNSQHGILADSLGYIWIADTLNSRITVNKWP